jgi:4-hydroxy-tetrahydrodipicolinate synthase
MSATGGPREALAEEFLRGSYTPLVTPFRDGVPDLETYARLVERQVELGSQGIVVNGTTAQPSSLTVPERKLLLKTALRTVAGRLPVVAATGSQSHAETTELTLDAEEAGADAVLIVTPYYVRPSQRALVEYFVDLGCRTRLPLLLYHIPGRAAVSLEVETVQRIAERTPNLVGIKHAAPDLGFVSRLLARLSADFRVFAGLEELSFPMLCLGAAGLMNAVGNLAPEPVAALWRAVASGHLAEGRRLHYRLLELNEAVFWDTNPVPMKYLMRRLGLLERDEHRRPLLQPSPEVAARLDVLLERNRWLDPAATAR